MKTAIIIIIIFITLCLISGQVLCVSVFGCSGGSLMFKCMYKTKSETDDQHKVKSFCRDRSCKMSISADVQSRWVYNGRFALYDDENSRFFTVFIRNLSIEDEWEYTCGNSQTRKHDVKLAVNRSRCGKSVIRDGYRGQKKITFRCEYEEKFKRHTKVFYRLNADPVHVLNSSRSSQSSEKKFNLSDSHKDHFNVTIRDISAADGGVYLCGVERDGSDHRPSETSIPHISFSTEIQLNVYSQTSVQVQAYSSKSVFITCTFPQEFKGNKKFLQRDSQKKILVDKQNQWVHYDKVHMFDDSSEGRLQVFISDLTAADEATYRCGVNIADDEDLFSEIKLTVKQVDNFPASSKASAVIGESVKLTCKFPEKHNETFTHFCKENKEKICERISSSEKRFEFSAGPAGVCTVSISNVSVRDAGVYWCGAETRHTHLTSVSLTNGHLLTPTLPPVVGREGNSSEIKCPYDGNHSTEIKYLCKGKCFTPDAQNITRSDEAHVIKPKISVKDETELNLFTVTLSDLRAEDSGIYWCAVKEAFNLPIKLMILKDVLLTPEASVGGSVSISCKNVTGQTLRLFCRGDQPNICVRDGVRVSSSNRANGRFSLTDETSAGVFTVNISGLTEEDSGKYWCAEESSGSLVFTEVHLRVIGETTSPDTEREEPQDKGKSETTSPDTEREAPQDKGKSGSFVIVAVSVGLILLAVCLVLILLKIKYSCKHGIISSSDRRETGDHERVQDSDPTSTPLYSTVQLPTIPSDLQNPLYSTAQLPTIPSDLQNPLYSTAQLPTIPSDGVLYASVSFQKHEESLSDTKVVFRKNEIDSDYASVKHNNTPH